MDTKLKELEKKTGYTFRDFSLLKQAMMHSSYTNEKHLPKYRCNERLEFLGDAVLELVSSEYLFKESRGRERDSVTSDAMEALIGAVYLDGGFTSAKEFIRRFILTDLEDKKLFYDSKTILQEMVQAKKNGEITYHLVSEQGPDHNKSFEVEVQIKGTGYGRGIGRTKKSAEQQAAYQAILKLRKQR